MNMTTPQTIYTVLFSVFYAVTIASTNGLNLFDTPSMISGSKKAWKRFFLGLVFNNAIPFLLFWIVINRLGSFEGSSFYVLLVIFIQSAIGFGLYRILFGFLTIRHGDQYYFYSSEDDRIDDRNKKINPIQKALNSRPLCQGFPRNHIISGSVWVIVSFTLLFTIH